MGCSNGVFAFPQHCHCASFIMHAFSQLIIQEVPAFRDFWYQKGITKFGDHEF